MGGTVPITSGLIGQIFGIGYLSTLSGVTFMSRQIGSFFGVLLGGNFFDITGSYDSMWVITIVAGIFAALVNWPIDDRRIVRQAAKPAAA